MSYICMLANENGIAAAGDSRLTLAPIPMHLDHTRKVFSAPEQGLVWACCGMMVWAGINYARWTSHIMRRPWPLERKLEAVARRVGPMLRVCNRVLRRDTLFSLLVGVGTPGAVELVSLDLVNGKSRVRRWRAPAVSEAGWKGRLRPPRPRPGELRGKPVEELTQIARERVRWAVERDRALSKEKPAHRQTVGGAVRSVSLRVDRRGNPADP